MKIDIDYDKLSYRQAIELYDVIFDDQFPNFGLTCSAEKQKEIIKKCIESGKKYEVDVPEGALI